MKTVVSAYEKTALERTTLTVPKELIPHLHFPKEEVLSSRFDRLQREKDLEQAILLGNLYHTKVNLYFEDIEGMKCVNTTIWGLTDQQVILKRNTTVPIHRIVQVQY